MTAQAQVHDWENPAVLGINKLPYHATLQLPSKQKECTEILSLDGQWLFHWSKDPESRPIGFEREDYDVSQWDTITVPGNWQLQGFGKPIYVNMRYPFHRGQPSVTGEPDKNWYAYDHRNPVGSYVTYVEVTKEMLSQNLILHFGSVHSAFYVWINGQKVGYSQNSMSPAEFDVTKYMRNGRNKLAVEVYRWSDGSYLECQDMWRLSGIFRPVQLWVRPLVHIADYKVEAIPNADYSKYTVHAKISVCNTGKKTAKNLLTQLQIACAELYGINTNPGHRNVANHLIQKLPAGDTTTVELTFRFDSSPHLWSAEKPWLYPFTVELLGGKDSKNDEHFDNHFGVKRVECIGEVFKINGKNVKLRGVNRHDHHPVTGRYVDDATYEKDITLMKQANINFLRTSHYPDRTPHPHYYEVQHTYQPLTFVRESDGNIRIINRDSFTDPDEYDITRDTLTIDGERLLNVYARLREDKPWAKKGFVVASEQFVLTPYEFPQPSVHPSLGGAGGGSITINGNAITSWVVDGREMLQAPLEPYFWKPENDNQHAAGFAQRTAVWKNATDVIVNYTIIDERSVLVEMNCHPTGGDKPIMPKIGMRMRLPADMTNIEYFGRGPWENYPDRKRSAYLGRYQMPLSEYETEYIHPQDNGNHCDVRWFCISSVGEFGKSGMSGRALRIDGCQPLCIRAWDYGEEDLEQAAHPREIQRGRFVNLNIDLNIHGVGGIDTWGARTLPQYTIDGNLPHHYAFILTWR